MINSKKISGTMFNDKPLLTLKDNSQCFYEIILKKIDERMNALYSKTSQILFVRLEIRFPQNLITNSDNRCFQYFINEYRRYLSDKYANDYIWVKEQNNSHNPHFHLLLMLDGNRIRYYRNCSKATTIWARALKTFYEVNINAKGLIQVCGYTHGGVKMNNGINVHRENLALRSEIFRICSYLAKTYTKEQITFGRGFGASVLRGKK